MSTLRCIGDLIGFLLLTIVAILEGFVKFFIPLKYRMKSIEGEIALVTGGGGGLGRLLSLRLANLGAIVVVWDINKTGIEETVKIITAAGGTCYGYVCDVCDREDVYRKAAVVKEEVGNVSILINNAGVVSGMNFLDIPDKVIIRTMEVNVMSHFWTVKAFLPSMMENNKGHIVSIASLAGTVGIPKLTDYCASKFAAVGFDEALNMELQAEGYSDIHTTLICPYFIRNTGMFEEAMSRLVPTLSANDVAERTIVALRCNEKVAVLPGFMGKLVGLKWFIPWISLLLFLRCIVVDASPVPNRKMKKISTMEEEPTPILMKEHNSNNIHQQLTRRISSSERKP